MDGDEAIAIVGIGCKFPGANNVEEYWNLLLNGECHVKDIPKERFNTDAIYDKDPSTPGKGYAKTAGLIERPFQWEHERFGYNEDEAAAMDPQQRYVLECVDMALVDGGLTQKDLDATKTAVFIGAMNSDYKSATTDDDTLLTNYTVTGSATSIISARVSYHYNLLGPAITIDTACSSALVAIHLGAESIKSGESTMAICGGVNSILYRDMFISLCRARMASASGQCRAFSAEADGYTRGEGCGIVILEKVGDALRNGHTIWGRIQTGCNQDGKTVTPMTAPSKVQQTKLMQDVYEKFQIDASDIQYIEAHGTGTPVGDPIEVNSLGEFFKPHTVRIPIHDKHRLIGSVKTNIGHSESAAGIASLIKVLLMMKHEKVVPSLHSEKLNPDIAFDDFRFLVPRRIYMWHIQENGFRMACVNCFGFGGTNCHAVVKQYVNELSPTKVDKYSFKHPYIVTFSAKTAALLVEVLKQFQLSREKRQQLKDISYTSLLQHHFRYRIGFSVNEYNELLEKCSKASNLITSNSKPAPIKRHVCFILCGVGTAWQGMCQEMMSNLVFKKTVIDIDCHFKQLAGWSIVDTFSDGKDIKDPFVGHIAIFVCQVGLAKVWEDLGLIPDAITGQSVGEVAAAFLAGYLSLKDAVHVIYTRSLLLSKLKKGKMMVVQNCKVELVQEVCSKLKSGKVNIAVFSSPEACTVTGDEAAFDELELELRQQRLDRLRFKKLDVNCAYHSHFVEPAASKLTELIEVCVQKPKITLFSTVTGEKANDEFATPKYWGKNTRAEVKMYHALQAMVKDRHENIFIEIGPKPVLEVHLNDVFLDKTYHIFPSMRVSKEFLTFYQSVASVYQLGVDLKWRALAPKDGCIVEIPQAKTYTKDLKIESMYVQQRCQGSTEQHSSATLLKRTDLPDTFSVTVTPHLTPFIYHHIIDEAVIVPGAFYAEIALELGIILLSGIKDNLEVSYDIVHFVSLSKNESCGLEIISNRQANNNHCIKFSVKHNYKVVAEGFVKKTEDTCRVKNIPISQIIENCHNTIETTYVYDELRRSGYTYEGPNQLFYNLMYNDTESMSELRLTKDVQDRLNDYVFHPAIMDAMFHPMLLLFLRNCANPGSTQIFPVKIGSLAVRSHFGTRMICYARKIQEKDNKVVTNFLLIKEDGYVVAELKHVEHEIIDGSLTLRSIMHDVDWTKFDIDALGDRKSVNEKNLLIIFSQEKEEKALKIIFPEANFFPVHCNVKDKNSFLETENELKAALQRKPQVVIFCAGIQHSTEKPNEVFDATCLSCHLLLSVIRASDKNLPLVVFSERTQIVQGFPETEKREPNVYGAELWGFARSARLDTSHPIVLVDMQVLSKKEQENLKYFVMRIDSFLTNANQFDFVFSDEMIFCCAYIQKKTNMIQCDKRDLKLSSLQVADRDLRSSNPNVLENPFLIRSMSVRMLTKNTIQVTAASHIEVLALQNNTLCQIWPECEESGYPVLAYEHYGKMFDATSKYSSKTKNVVACFPALCCSRVEIPPECTITLDKSTVYKPGILTPFVIGWYLAENINSKSVCIICNDPSLCSEAITLKAILESRHVATCTMCPMQVVDMNCGKVNTLVLLTKTLLQKVFNSIEHVQNVVGFQEIISETISKLLHLKKRRTKVRTLQKFDVFEFGFLKAHLPKIYKFMKKYPILTERVSKCLQRDQMMFFQGNDMVKQNHLIKVHLKPEDIIKRNATYIVVGGLTGLGWEVVKWLARMGAENVMTLSRKLPDKEAISKIKNVMFLHKTTIRHEQCDICDLESFEDIVRSLPSGSLKGVFHGAAVLEDCHINKMTREKIDKVLRPKVLGTLNLHTATKHLDLDLFVLHSSISSLLGNFGQTNYSAANAFLDTFAFYRRFHNLPCQLINWGALDVGLVGNYVKIKEQLRQMGHTPLDSKTIGASLSDAITRNEEQMIYAHFDFNKFAITFQTKRQQQKESKVHTGNTNDLFSKLEFSENVSGEKLHTVQSIVLSAIAEVMAIAEPDIECDQSLVSQGVDSQQAVLLTRKILEKTGCRLPIAHILMPDYTVENIVEFLASQNTENRAKIQQTVDVIQTVTHFEKIIYNISKEQEHASFAITFLLKESFSTKSMWEDILRHLILKFPELRSQIVENENHFFQMEKKVSNPEDAQIILNCHDCNRFKLSDRPLKMFFLEKDTTTSLKLVFNPVILDVKSISLVVNEMYTLAICFIENGSFPELKVLKTVNQVGIVKRKLKDLINPLERFWTSHMATIQKETKMLNATDDTIPKEFCHSKFLLDATVAEMKTLQIDESNLLCCLYGLVLSKLKSLTHVPMIVCTNVRRHLPEIVDRVFMGDNFIPVILTYPDDTTLEGSAMSQLGECKNSGLYPYEILRQLDCFQKLLFRHQFRADVLSWPIDGWPNRVFEKAEVLSNLNSVYEMDTRLTMTKYEHSGKIELCFSCKENFMDKHLAESVMYDLEHLVLEFLENRHRLCKDYSLQRKRTGTQEI